MDLSIVFTNYDTSQHLQKCLDSIRQFPPRCRHEIVIVNNGSKQDTPESLHTLGEDMRVIDLPTNVGFGQACNVGMMASQGRYILLLNTDTYFSDASLQSCWDYALTNPEVDLFSCRVEYPDGRPQAVESPLYSNPTLAAFNEKLEQSVIIDKHGRSRLSVRRHLLPIGSWLSGCFLFFRREVYEKTGGFAPDFYLYYEEVDWFRNHIYPGGFKVGLCESATVTHVSGASQAQQSIREQALLSSYLYYYKCSRSAFVAAISGDILNLCLRSLHLPLAPRSLRRNLSDLSRLARMIIRALTEIPRYPSRFASRPFPLTTAAYGKNYSWSKLTEAAVRD